MPTGHPASRQGQTINTLQKQRSKNRPPGARNAVRFIIHGSKRCKPLPASRTERCFGQVRLSPARAVSGHRAGPSTGGGGGGLSVGAASGLQRCEPPPLPPPPHHKSILPAWTALPRQPKGLLPDQPSRQNWSGTKWFPRHSLPPNRALCRAPLRQACPGGPARPASSAELDAWKMPLRPTVGSPGDSRGGPRAPGSFPAAGADHPEGLLEERCPPGIPPPSPGRAKILQADRRFAFCLPVPKREPDHSIYVTAIMEHGCRLRAPRSWAAAGRQDQTSGTQQTSNTHTPRALLYPLGHACTGLNRSPMGTEQNGRLWGAGATNTRHLGRCVHSPGVLQQVALQAIPTV